MTANVRADDQVQEALINLFQGSMPEKKEEVSTLLQDLTVVFQMLPDVHPDGRVIMDAGLYRYVRFNQRVTRAFWIGSFAAWEGYRSVAEGGSAGEFDIEKLKAMISAFEATIENDQADDTPLPTGIPEPGYLPEMEEDPQRRAAAELSIIALGWAFLHEVRHIRHQREGTSAGAFGSPESKRQEEFSCDEFATRFILEGIPLYSDESGDDAQSVKKKRELAIYFALFAMTLLSKNKWEESETHPAVQARIDAVCAAIGQDRNEDAVAIANMAFTALRKVWPAAPMIMAGQAA
ncbi:MULTISPECIES: phage exclusion protein Lit family protein [Aeromonas]|uniref:phage exclusion protein Lit family protein n=1 Tax=Aeromonas TaxID=642 RepID=UPI002B05B930|nr:phage exclusion protein Lit family protein [Aeromonas jandaei]